MSDGYVFRGEAHCHLTIMASGVAWDGSVQEMRPTAFGVGSTPAGAVADATAKAMDSLLIHARALQQRPTSFNDEPVYWLHDELPEDHSGAVIDYDGELWVQLVSHPDNETFWMHARVTNLETRNWSELQFPVHMAPDQWAM